MKDFNKFPFVVDKHNNVWKYVKAKDHFIKVTPWEPGEDRRVNRFEIEKLINKNELTQMKNKSAVNEIINNRWREVDYSWEYKGRTYYVDPFHSTKDCMKAPQHAFRHTYKDASEKEPEYFSKYRLGFHNGHIVWFNPYHYFPQLCIWPFEDINKEPKGYNSWGNANSVRPIYEASTGNYI